MPHYIYLPCLLRFLLTDSFSEFPCFYDPKVLRSIGQVHCRLLSVGICLMFFSRLAWDDSVQVMVFMVLRCDSSDLAYTYTLYKCMLNCFSLLQLFATPLVVAFQAHLSMGFQARALKWVATSFSRGSSRPRDWTYISWSSCIANGFLTPESQGSPVTSWDFYEVPSQMGMEPVRPKAQRTAHQYCT